MKVVLYMAQTVNGLIARENFDEEFSKEDASSSVMTWDMFVEFAEKIGCFVIGRTSYEIYKRNNDPKYNLGNIKAKRIILSSNHELKLDRGFILATSPEDALEKASKLGFSKVMVTGGGKVNGSFMKAGLIDEIIVNVEPYLLGKGIRIFAENEFESKLKLVDVKKMKFGIVQLHYDVVND